MFISPAFAQEATETTAKAEPSALMTMAPLLIIFVLFYLLVIRPQSKRMRAHGELLKQLKVGDQVITNGLYGKIVTINDNDMIIEIASGVNVKAQKHAVSALQETGAADIKAVK